MTSCLQSREEAGVGESQLAEFTGLASSLHRGKQPVNKRLAQETGKPEQDTVPERREATVQHREIAGYFRIK